MSNMFQFPSNQFIDDFEQILDRYEINELHISAAQNNFRQVNNCINYLKIDINCRDTGGNTALHYAARYNNFKMSAFLCECGADIEAKNNHDQTPLHFSYQSYGLETVRVLRNRGASTKTRDIDGICPAATRRLRTQGKAPMPLFTGLHELSCSSGSQQS